MASFFEFGGSGILLTSASIGGSGEPTGSLQRMFFESSDPNGTDFQIRIPSQSTGDTQDDTIALYITASGRSPFVGIGTNDPQSTFDIKEVKDDAQGSKFFLRSARPTKGADPSDAAGTIQFIIDSGSYNDLSTSGSVASITTDVLSVTDEGAAGNLLLKVATSEKTAPEEVFKLSARYDTDGHELTGKLQISNKLTVNSNISASGAVTASSAKFGDTSVYIDGNGGNITASANISASGALITGYLTASGLNYPDTDGLDRQVIKTDGLGNLSFGYAENVEITIKNVSGGTINKGTPCFITASGTSGNVAGVIPADAGDLTKMPAGVIAGETILDEAEGLGLVNGFIQGVDTSTFTSGDTVYVAVGGGYTNVKPTGSGAFIQKLGNVEKVDASNGSGVINGPGYYNDLPNWEEGKIQVGTSTYPVTSSVISLDETNKYVSGSESAKFKLDTYAFGYNAFPGIGFDVTGSGIIVSSSLPSLHYPMVKIGETELVDLTTDTALSDHTFTIHNVDNFQVTSGSEPTDVSTNKLFEHTGNAFNVYTNGDTTKIIDASSTSVRFGATDLYLAPSSTVYLKASSTSSTPQYVAAWDSEPIVAGTGASLKYVTASTFTGGGGSSAYHTWIGGRGENASQVTFGTQWRGGMSGNTLGGSFLVSADTSIFTFSSGTPTVGDTVSASNYKIITALIHPGTSFTTIDWYGHLRAYNAACDGNDHHMEIWTLDDVNDLVGFGTTTLTFRGGNQWTYDGTSSTIKPIITSGSISHTGTETTAFVVVSHVPTNPASSMQFVYKFDFTVT
jgi:hypothetical protein